MLLRVIILNENLHRAVLIPTLNFESHQGVFHDFNVLRKSRGDCVVPFTVYCHELGKLVIKDFDLSLGLIELCCTVDFPNAFQLVLPIN